MHADVLSIHNVVISVFRRIDLYTFAPALEAGPCLFNSEGKASSRPLDKARDGVHGTAACMPPVLGRLLLLPEGYLPLVKYVLTQCGEGNARRFNHTV
jgi:hypothetical protein